jgi:hypothetical protein
MSARSDEEIRRSIAAKLARKLADAPKSMAWILAKYRDAEGIDEAALAQRLGIDIDELPHLGMYGRPRQYLFAEDVQTISERFGIDQLVLSSLVRHVEALETFRTYQDTAGATGLVAAARDRAAEESSEYDAESNSIEPASEPESDDEQ